MRRIKPDPEGFKTAIRQRGQTGKRWLGDRFGLFQFAARFGISPEDARGILAEEGWRLEEEERSGLGFWWAPGRGDGG